MGSLKLTESLLRGMTSCAYTPCNNEIPLDNSESLNNRRLQTNVSSDCNFKNYIRAWRLWQFASFSRNITNNDSRCARFWSGITFNDWIQMRTDWPRLLTSKWNPREYLALAGQSSWFLVLCRSSQIFKDTVNIMKKKNTTLISTLILLIFDNREYIL